MKIKFSFILLFVLLSFLIPAIFSKSSAQTISCTCNGSGCCPNNGICAVGLCYFNGMTCSSPNMWQCGAPQGSICQGYDGCHGFYGGQSEVDVCCYNAPTPTPTPPPPPPPGGGNPCTNNGYVCCDTSSNNSCIKNNPISENFGCNDPSGQYQCFGKSNPPPGNPTPTPIPPGPAPTPGPGPGGGCNVATGNVSFYAGSGQWAGQEIAQLNNFTGNSIRVDAAIYQNGGFYTAQNGVWCSNGYANPGTCVTAFIPYPNNNYRADFNAWNSCNSNNIISGTWYDPAPPPPPPPPPPPNCNICNCGACYNAPANTCYNNNGTQQCSCLKYSGGGACTAQFYNQGCTYNNCNVNNFCINGNCQPTYTIAGNTFNDYNHNGLKDAGENGIAGAAINAAGQNTNSAVNGSFTFNNVLGGTYTITAAQANYLQTTNNKATVGPSSYNNNIGLTPLFTITGSVNVDYDHNAGTNPSDADDITFGGGNWNVAIVANGTQNTTPQLNKNGGNFTYSNLESGQYTITFTPPPKTNGYIITPGVTGCTNTQCVMQVTVGPNNTANFYITPIYNISGRLYDDQNQSLYYTPGVDKTYNNGTLPNGSLTFTTNGGSQPQTPSPNSDGSYPINSDGTYTFTGLLSGQYTITYNTPANFAGLDYTITNPGPPATFVVSAGAQAANLNANFKCNAGTYHATDTNANPSVKSPSSCITDAQNNLAQADVVGLNIAVNNEISSYQTYCGDLSVNGGVIDKLPASGYCGSAPSNYASVSLNGNPQSAGTVYTGNSFSNFGAGQASQNGWLVGGPTYSSNFTSVNPGLNRTSYSYMMASAVHTGTPLTDLASVCTLSNCTLPGNLAPGWYHATSDVVLNGYTFPNGNNYILLINGSLTIMGNILTAGTSTLNVSTTGDIVIDKTVGEKSIVSLHPDIMGYFTTDGSFLINSYGTSGNTCNTNGTNLDNKLNLVGSIIASGGVENNRDLCTGDYTCPTYTINSGLCGIPTPTPGGGPTPTIAPVPPCIYNTDCPSGTTCYTSGGSTCSCQTTGGGTACNLGNPTPAPDGGGQTIGGSCIFDTDCQTGLSCNTNGSTCSCQASSTQGTCNLDGSAAGGVGILNMPVLIKHQNVIWQEVVP